MERGSSSNRFGVVAAVLTLASLSGCGGSDPAPAASAQPAAAPAPVTATTPTAAAPAQTNQGAAPRSGGTKWIGGIPYDVFYDRPLEVASDQTPLVAVGTPAVVTPATTTPAAVPAPTTTTPDPMPAVASTRGEVDWATLAPIEVVTEHVMTLRNELQNKLNTLATYNQNWETIGVDAICLATLSGVVERHPGDVSWKANAKIARDLATGIDSGATKTGRSAYDATKEPFDNLVDLLSGNPPADVEADDLSPFGDFADRSVLMATLESTLADMKSNITTQDRLEADPAATKRKMTVLATLMTVMTTESYEYTAEKDYQAFSKKFVDAAISGRDAVDGKNLDTFTAAVAELQKNCTDCHAKYAFGGDSF